MKISRKINWLSSINGSNYLKLFELQKRMQEFYAYGQNYYADISFTEHVWNDDTSLVQQDILSLIQGKKSILEVGCGQAYILKTSKVKEENYTGIDFSSDLIFKNKAAFPNSKFAVIDDPKVLPVESEAYDLVFSHYVIEHTVFPNIFLDECNRVLKPNGTLIIVAPDFLGRNRMTSQKAGFSNGSGRQKFKDGRYFDMLITGFDSKIKIPLATIFCKLLAAKKPKFFINVQPTCFVYEFSPDVDAVYLTYKKEIKTYLNSCFDWLELSNNVKQYVRQNNSLYIKGIKTSKQIVY